MQNREISWLRFNDRVLSEAGEKNVAAFEKLKFISIFVSNLDEFFMVRVGRLHYMDLLKKAVSDSKTGMSPKEQIDAILKMLPDMYRKKDELYEKVMKELEEYNIRSYEFSELTKEYLEYVEKKYKENINPLLFAQIIDKQRPFPFIENGALAIILELEKSGKKYLGVIEIPKTIQKFILLPGEGVDYIMTEKVVYEHANVLFEGYEIKSKSIIKITRNFDLDTDTDLKEEFSNYKDKMKKILKKRKRQSVVRVESNNQLPEYVIESMLKKLKLDRKAYFHVESPLNMKYVFELLDLIPSAKKEKVLYPNFTPYYFNKGKKYSVMDIVKKKDLFLSYPYDDIQTFIDLLDEAADDENVTSIKITIYRLAKKSKIVKSLCRAAENGKEVIVIIELKARFDEESNIDYSDRLLKAGCKISYGFEEYKIHSKICHITYKDDFGESNYITQIGTGNYNESTAKMYTDFCIITGNREIGLDADDFFNNMISGNINGKYEHIVQSPSSLKDKFMKLIEREIEKGPDGFLFFKMNSFTDKDIIEKLSEASRKKVKVIMIIRGICCLLPGIEGETENIEVRSIVGRFLEHPRIYQFGKNENADVYIGSADLMTRNTEKRVEIACPIFDEDIKKRIQEYVRIQLRDNVKARELNSKGEYESVVNGFEPLDSQAYFIEEAIEKQKKDFSEFRKENNNHKYPEEKVVNTEERTDTPKKRGFLSKLFRR